MEEITERLVDGARLFNDEEYFEAHEVWEEEWHGSIGTNKDFLQGLIQTAAAYVHHERGNVEGVLRLSSTALCYLEEVPSEYRGVDVDHVREINRQAKNRARSVLDSDDGFLILMKPRIEVEVSE